MGYLNTNYRELTLIVIIILAKYLLFNQKIALSGLRRALDGLLEAGASDLEQTSEAGSDFEARDLAVMPLHVDEQPKLPSIWKGG